MRIESRAEPAWPGRSEVATRLKWLKEDMAAQGIHAFILTSRPNFEYFTGFRSLFWLSDTRPFLAVVRRDASDVSLVVSRTEERNDMLREPGLTAVVYDGFTAAAVSATVGVLADLPAGSTVALDYGDDMCGRGSLELIAGLQRAIDGVTLVEGAATIWRRRMVKSPRELEMKRIACSIATTAFFAGLGGLEAGVTERAFGQALTGRMIGLGAASVDWLPIRFGRGEMSYSRPNGDRALRRDDFIWVDMGARFADQISDLNRVAKAGPVSPGEQAAYGFVRDVTLRTCEAVRPGMSGGEVHRIFHDLWSKGEYRMTTTAGRIGHGSGLSLTEPPSLMAGSAEIIEEDMVLHVEPKLEHEGGVFQTEEVFRVTARGVEFLSDPAPPRLPSVEM